MNRTFYKKLVNLVLPIAFQQFMLSLVSASDAVMLGMIDQDSLSAVSLATQVSFVYDLFLAAITIGESIFAAQYWGKKDKKAVEQVLAISLRASGFVSVLFFLATLCTPELLMHIFTNNQSLIDSGATYLRAVSFSYLFCGVCQCYLCIMKNSGHASASMIISSAMVVLNIVLNSIMIFGLLFVPRLGIAGAALATTVTRLVEVICVIVWMRVDAKHMQIKLAYLRSPDVQLKKDYWKYTTPVLGNEIVWGCGFTMYSVIMGHLGTDAVAANSLANIVKNIVACFCGGLGAGGGIMVGNELGAGNSEAAKLYGGKLTVMSIISGAITAVIILIFLPITISVSSLSAEASALLKWMFLISAINMIGRSINGTTIGGIFCAGGDSKFGFLCDAVTMWCVTVPLGMVAAFILKWPVPVVYVIMSSDEIIKLPVVYKHYKQYKWVKNLTKGE